MIYDVLFHDSYDNGTSVFLLFQANTAFGEEFHAYDNVTVTIDNTPIQLYTNGILNSSPNVQEVAPYAVFFRHDWSPLPAADFYPYSITATTLDGLSFTINSKLYSDPIIDGPAVSVFSSHHWLDGIDPIPCPDDFGYKLIRDEIHYEFDFANLDATISVGGNSPLLFNNLPFTWNGSESLVESLPLDFRNEILTQGATDYDVTVDVDISFTGNRNGDILLGEVNTIGINENFHQNIAYNIVVECEPPCTTPIILASATDVCLGSVTLSVNNLYNNYQWKNEGGLIIGLGSTVTITEAGTYELYVNGESGNIECVGNVSIVIDACDQCCTGQEIALNWPYYVLSHDELDPTGWISTFSIADFIRNFKQFSYPIASFDLYIDRAIGSPIHYNLDGSNSATIIPLAEIPLELGSFEHDWGRQVTNADFFTYQLDVTTVSGLTFSADGVVNPSLNEGGINPIVFPNSDNSQNTTLPACPETFTCCGRTFYRSRYKL